MQDVRNEQDEEHRAQYDLDKIAVNEHGKDRHDLHQGEQDSNYKVNEPLVLEI